MHLISWNVQWFCGVDGVVSIDRVVDEANSMADFDVLCLQEVAVNYPRLAGNAGFDQVARLRELLPGYQIVFGAAVDEQIGHGPRQQFGNLIATRLPLAQVQHYPLPYPADDAVRSMPRMCTVATMLTPMGPLRVMTTHLEFYSPRQRLKQTEALVDLHTQACAHSAQPPLADESGEPFQSKVHTESAVLCGDFNFERGSLEYAHIQSKPQLDTPRFIDAWAVVHDDTPQDPTFRLFDRRYGPTPICCDFVFVSENLKSRVKSLQVNMQTRASDHQPVLLRMV
ncbi:MAG: endonuclease/exonuclease/phosphatase family protein [Burkholderiales bacterium]|nr:endonuclease/exonuclease/phosphatase family protein [Burkholderiales bacterium]